MKNEAEGKLYTGVDLQSGSIKFFCDPNFDNAKAGQIFEAVENYDRLKARVDKLTSGLQDAVALLKTKGAELQFVEFIEKLASESLEERA